MHRTIPAILAIIFGLTFIGGCSGSTAFYVSGTTKHTDKMQAEEPPPWILNEAAARKHEMVQESFYCETGFVLVSRENTPHINEAAPMAHKRAMRKIKLRAAAIRKTYGGDPVPLEHEHCKATWQDGHGGFYQRYCVGADPFKISFPQWFPNRQPKR